MSDDPDEDGPPVALIPFTEVEARVIATLVFNGSTETVTELTADVAKSILGKLRGAVFQER